MERPKKRKWWILLLVILVVAAVAAVLLLKNAAEQAAAAVAAMGSAEQTYTVERGTLEKTITGTGVLAASDTELVKAPNGLLVEKVLVTAGEAVKKGQPLVQFDGDSVYDQLVFLEKKVSDADNGLKTAGVEDSITAPATGRVKYQPVKEGDDVMTAMQQYGVLAILSTDGWMRFSIETDRVLTLGSRMTVRWPDGRATGTVDRKTDKGYVVLVPDSHAPYLGTATLMDGDTEIGSGTLFINLPAEVVGRDGVVRTIRYHLDESVPDGREMFALRVPPVNTSFASKYTARSKFMDLYKRVIALSAGDPVIVAPCDGVIGEISVKVGETVGKVATAEADSALLTLGTGGARKLTVNIDELDILSVMLGQTAEISLDAMPGEPLNAEVTRISVSGKKENSISTFPVELTMPDDARLMAGMNGTATILAERVENVLLVPLEAVEEDSDGEYVYVLAADGTKTRTKITTGRSDETLVEVTEGLGEGDVVSYRAAQDDMGFGGAMGVVSVG